MTEQQTKPQKQYAPTMVSLATGATIPLIDCLADHFKVGFRFELREIEPPPQTNGAQPEPMPEIEPANVD